jgi:hypothetical protein
VANPSKRKGSGFEREVVHLLTSLGVKAERVPLSGAAGGSFTGDVDVLVRNDIGTWNQKKLECKRRRGGFKTLYGWLGSNYGLAFRDDNTEPLIVLRLSDFANLIK